MWVDRQNQFSGKVVGGASTDQLIEDSGDTFSTDTINIGKGRDIGTGEEKYIIVHQTDDDADGPTQAVTVTLQESDAETGTFTDVQTLGTIPSGTDGVAGLQTATLTPRIQPGVVSKQYLRLKYSTGGATENVTIKAYISDSAPNYTNYESGFDISV